MKSNKEVVVEIEPVEILEEKIKVKMKDNMDSKRIGYILKSQIRRIEVSCCVMIVAEELLELESVERKETLYIYGIISNLENMFVKYQIPKRTRQIGQLITLMLAADF